MDGGTERTGCYAFFLIKSAGVLDFDKGFLPEPDSAFDPDEITALLGLQPFRAHRAGEARPGGRGRYPFSAWYSCRQAEPAVSRLDQCGRIAAALRPHIPALRAIRERYNVTFSIEIDPQSPDEGGVIGMTHDVIEFCYLTGTEIVVDLFCYRDV